MSFISHTNRTNAGFLNTPKGKILVPSGLLSFPLGNVYMSSWFNPDNAAYVDSLPAMKLFQGAIIHTQI
jgi:hypothetical protein